MPDEILEKSPVNGVNDDDTNEDIREMNEDSDRNSIEVKSLHELARVNTSLQRDMAEAAKSDSRRIHKKKRALFIAKTKKLLRYMFYPEVILTHLNFPDLKVVLRSWLMMWSLTLMCICGGSAEFMGPSSFLANFACGIEISGNLSVAAALVYCLTDELTLIISFTISVVTMGINYRLHGYPTERDLINDMLQRGYCQNVSVPTFENCVVPHIHLGLYMTTRTTTITIFGMIFSFSICGLIQQRFKYARLAWLLNSLFTIIVFPFNNFCPLFRPWYYARNCVVPMSMAFTTRFVASMLVLPFSSNSRVMSNLSVACSKLQNLCDKMENNISSSRPSTDNIAENFEFIRGDAQTIFTKHVINEIDMEMIGKVEIWLSRVSKDDLCDLRSQIRLVMSATSSFRFFFVSIQDRKQDILNEDVGPLSAHADASDRIKTLARTPKFISQRLSQSYKATGSYESYRSRLSKDEISYLRDRLSIEALDYNFQAVTKKYEPLVRQSTQLLGHISTWLSSASKYFTFNRHTYFQAIADLQKAFDSQQKLLEECAHLQNLEPEFALHAYNCVHYARRVKRLGKLCILIHNKNPEAKPRLVTPFSSSSAMSSHVADNDYEIDGIHDNLNDRLNRTFTSFKPLVQVQVRNPDSSPPRIFLHILGSYVEKCVDILYAPDVVFSIKRSLLVTATLTPYFCRPICERAYKHWFLWVAVLTSYTVARQAVDGLYGLVTKFVYNFWGCLVGMVAWYISAGSGRGNPFSYAVVTAFVWLYICFQRQFNKHFNPSSSVVFNCTVTLVLGNSWNAGHIVLPGVELGRGFNVAWVRFVTVSIGISISFVGTIFPHAYTAKKFVRNIIGSCLEHVGDLHASISNFAVQRYTNPGVHIVASSDIITKSARAIMTDLDSAETLRARLIYEPPLSGFYPTHRYKLLINYAQEITQLMSLVYTFFDELDDPSHMPQVLSTMGWTNPSISGGVYSLLYMSSRAIADAKALPSVTSGYLATKYICDVLPEHLQDAESFPTPLYTTAIALTTQVYKRVDGIVCIIKELVGEVYDLNMGLYDLESQQPSPRRSR